MPTLEQQVNNTTFEITSYGEPLGVAVVAENPTITQADNLYQRVAVDFVILLPHLNDYAPIVRRTLTLRFWRFTHWANETDEHDDWKRGDRNLVNIKKFFAKQGLVIVKEK